MPLLPGTRRIIARSDRLTALSKYDEYPTGLVTPQDEDPTHTVHLFQPDQNDDGSWPDLSGLTVIEAIGSQSRQLLPLQQLQYQDPDNATPLFHIYAVVDPRLPIPPSTVIPAASPSAPGVGVVCDTSNPEANADLTASFTVPAVGTNVQITVNDTAPFASSTELHVAGAGIFTPVSTDSATQMTVTWTGAPSAIVTTVG